MEVTGSSPVAPTGGLRFRRGSGGIGAVAQLGERSVRNAEVRGSTPLGSTGRWGGRPAVHPARRGTAFRLPPARKIATVAQLVEHVTRNDGVVGSSPTGGSHSATQPRGVTGNTSDSGSEESWFDPRRGYLEGWLSG